MSEVKKKPSFMRALSLKSSKKSVKKEPTPVENEPEEVVRRKSVSEVEAARDEEQKRLVDEGAQ